MKGEEEFCRILVPFTKDASSTEQALIGVQVHEEKFFCPHLQLLGSVRGPHRGRGGGYGLCLAHFEYPVPLFK